MDDRWRDSYDNWKLASPDDDCLDECWHDEFEADVSGRATCCQCGHRWWLTAEDIERERERSAEYDRMIRREERRRRWAEIVECIAFWRRWINRERPTDDEIPF